MSTITNTTTATGTSLVDAPAGTNPKGILGKDDFLKLLLIELQYQDPTEPMDSEKILSQTSQLATLESADNTNKALEELSNTLQSTTQFNAQFSTVAAIGKIADTGSNGMQFNKGETKQFEIYFPDDIASGNVEIKDSDGNIIRRIPLAENPSNVYTFTWDGLDSAGNSADDGVYYVEAAYANSNGEPQRTRAGAYPIESVRFEDGQTLLKLGSSYVPLDSIQEIYQ